MNNRLGCFSTTAVIAAIITALILASVAFASGSSMFSPGMLNNQSGKELGGVLSHAQISQDCSKCHTAFWENERMSDRCVVCHADITQQLANPLTLHGFLRESDPNMDCRDCHTEHHGATAILTAFKPFFPHEKLGYSLLAHPGVTCYDCHNSKYLTFDQQTCINCHRQRDLGFITAHELAYGTDCLSCHDGIESRGAKFDHAQTQFPLTGIHLGVICTKCHLNARTLADMQNTPKLCINCHAKDDPHEGRFGTACESCHNTDGWKAAKFDHNLTVFKLTGKHSNTACEACHVNSVFKDTPATCFGCHQKDDAHKGQFGSDCGTCHSPAGWKPAAFNHDLATFKLTGAHLNVSCTQCHINGVFKGTSSNCFACHSKDDHHNGSFGTNCGVCHSTTAWKPASFDHNLASFKLSGAHVNVSCTQCHKNSVFKGTPSDCVSCHSKDDHHGGSFGTNCGSCHSTSSWKNATFNHNISAFKLTGAHANVSCGLCHKNSVFKGTPSDCVSCHSKDDHHGGSFGTNCGSCHSTTSWKNATFDHNLSAFKLTGAHINVSCNSCHVNGIFKGTPSTCFACHAKDDNHGGSFGTSCGSCHSTASWKNAKFDHNLSAFKLTGAHINVSCSSCHVNGVFKGTPSNCVACHAEPSFHSGMFGTNCAQCHSTSNWNATYTGPHPNNRENGGIGHQGATCRDCHTQNLSSATCLKCHDSNNPGGGDRSPTPRSSPTFGPSPTPRSTSTQGPTNTPRPTRTPTATLQSTATSQPPTATLQPPTATIQPPTATSQPPTEPPQPTPTP